MNKIRSYVTELGSIGIVEKNRVNKTFELGNGRLFTTAGIKKGQILRPINNEILQLILKFLLELCLMFLS